ncbi:hypothetical protein F5050DRAFT_1805653 [Lentinula boryana]|uniref:BED-type domain-containing protein n=1 Tax=Lentinula boryana TaxID=40481 RepID=A0ABQ8QK24_9AGAR|nr:hypothetical protein F5050DRAFT_1805653 [Lentinula boryana]
MAPPRRDVFPDFEQNNENSTLYRCSICFTIDSRNANWMQRKSIKDHLKTIKHQDNAKLKIRREEKAASEQHRYQHTYISSITEPAQFQVRPRPQAPNMTFKDSSISFSPVEDDLFLSSEGPAAEEIDIEALLGEQFQALLADAVYLDEFGVDGGELEEINEPDEDEDEDDSNINLEAAQNEEYFPYPDKISMLLDILDNLPRLRLSTHSVKLILWMLKELGHNVPSLK